MIMKGLMKELALEVVLKSQPVSGNTGHPILGGRKGTSEGTLMESHKAYIMGPDGWFHPVDWKRINSRS